MCNKVIFFGLNPLKENVFMLYCVGLCECSNASGGFRMYSVFRSGIFRKERYSLWYTRKVLREWKMQGTCTHSGRVSMVPAVQTYLFGVVLSFGTLIQLNLVSVLQFNRKVHALPIVMTVIFLMFILHIKRARMNVHPSPYIAVFYKGYMQNVLRYLNPTALRGNIFFF
jgi:hypothetical protein